MILRVPSKLLQEIEKEKGLAFLVSITSHMVGELRVPSSMLVRTEKISPEKVSYLLNRGAKEVKQ